MRYRDVAIYAGTKTACDHCKRPFLQGQVIHLSEKQGLVFCDSDSDGPNLCMQNYLFFTFFKTNPNEMLLATPQVFGRHGDAGPVEHTRPTLRHRIARFFGLA